MIDLAALTARWESAFPGLRPAGHRMRGPLEDRWVRFHSLPGGKRYPDDEGEYAELLARHHAVLADLAGDPDARVYVTVPAFGADDLFPGVPAPARDAVHWRTLPADEYGAGYELRVLETTLGELDPLLREVADDQTGDVLVLPPTLEWAYHPYDGGADVFARSPEERDALRSRYAAWCRSTGPEEAASPGPREDGAQRVCRGARPPPLQQRASDPGRLRRRSSRTPDER